MAEINDLDIAIFEIGNAYLMAPVEDNSFTELVPEFKEDEGKFTIIVCAIY